MDWVDVHQGLAADIAADWTLPVDLLLLDGDHSPQGARQAYESWAPLLKPDAAIVLRNPRPHNRSDGHDGNWRLVLEQIVEPRYRDVHQIGGTTFARKSVCRAATGPAPRRTPASPRNASFQRPPRVHLYAQCWNDEFMLPFFFRHYDPFVERYVIYDDGSTDRSLSILADHPRVEIRRFVRSDPGSFALSEQSLSNQCWKESRGYADWVIVTDIDEHLVHRAMDRYLLECTAAAITLLPSLGFQMISDTVPRSAERLCDGYRLGAPWTQMMKPSIFNPTAIEDINFDTGRHGAHPVGDVRVPRADEILLLHYKYLNIDATLARHRQLVRGLGPVDRKNRWGHKYSWSFAELAEDWSKVAAVAVDVGRFLSDTPPPYPIEPWWAKFRDAANEEPTMQ
jgi:Glycosyl transferase family 2/Methyltransferase domain